MFIAALCTLAKRGKQPTCARMDEWVNTMGCIRATEYCSGTDPCSNVGEPRKQDGKSEESDVKAHIACNSVSTKCPKHVNPRRHIQVVVSRVLGEGIREWLLLGTGFYLGVMEIFGTR